MSYAANIGKMIVTGPLRKLEGKECKLLLHCAFLSERPDQEQLNIFREFMRQSPQLRMICDRFERHFGQTEPFSPALMLWLSFLADRPGNMVLLVAVLAYMKEQGQALTLNQLVDRHFAEGIPTPENYLAAWDAQKMDAATASTYGEASTNMLDRAESWY